MDGQFLRVRRPQLIALGERNLRAGFAWSADWDAHLGQEFFGADGI